LSCIVFLGVHLNLFYKRLSLDAIPRVRIFVRPGAAYCQRRKVERCFGWMDNCHRMVVRYDRHLRFYQTFCLVSIILWRIDRILK